MKLAYPAWLNTYVESDGFPALTDADIAVYRQSTVIIRSGRTVSLCFIPDNDESVVVGRLIFVCRYQVPCRKNESAGKIRIARRLFFPLRVLEHEGIIPAFIVRGASGLGKDDGDCMSGGTIVHGCDSALHGIVGEHGKISIVLSGKASAVGPLTSNRGFGCFAKGKTVVPEGEYFFRSGGKAFLGPFGSR